MSKAIPYIFLLLLMIGLSNQQVAAQAPPNDNCTSAETITITNAGFGLGNFTSSQTNITNATVQAGESFAPAIFVAGLDDKSVWFKFSLPTIRAVRITLSQPGNAIAAGNVGFAVYKTDSCLPKNSSISTKLTPIVTWGNTYHPCVPAGDYLVQVSSNANANGPIGITVEVSDKTGAAYDHPNEAYAFGVASPYARRIDFQAECQSIEDAAEVCNSLANKNEYHKSAWFTFTTPAYFDYLVVGLAGTGATQYFPGGGANILKKFGYNLYRGNAVSTPISNLALVDGCDSMLTNGYVAAKQVYRCGDLQPSTTYSIQLFIHKEFNEMLRLGILTNGIAPPAGPLPVNTLPASNTLGVLPASGGGTTTRFTDYFGCSSSHSTNGCGPAKPAAGVTVNGTKFNLSNFASFRLNNTAAITFRPGAFNCGPRPVIRLFKQTLTGNCADLDTANIVGTVGYNGEIECLGPGDYVLQVLGLDAPSGNLNTLYSSDLGSNSDLCLFTNLGVRFYVDMLVFTRKAASKYSLNVPGAFDSINRVGAVQQPLLPGVAYRAAPDTIGCQPTLRPFDTTCSPLNDKVIYRQFVVADSGTVDFSDLSYSNNPPFRYKLYSGNANALATAQGVFSFPEKVTGIIPKSLCLNGNEYCTNKSVCVEPGTYTFASFGSTADVGRADRPTFTFKKTRTLYNSLQNALNMGSIMDTLGANGGTLRGKRDYWSCTDNAIPINGYTPCAIAGRPATKAIYRQFYLKEDAVVRFSNPGYGGWCVGQAYGTRTLFYGKATDGMQGLSPVGNQWNCFSTASTTNNCAPLEAGWYTVVSWGTGPSYDSTMRLTEIGGRYNGYVSYFDEFDLTITPACPKPKFNRPHRASVSATNAPHLIQWGTRAISTPVYPRTDTVYRLPVENFNCTVDTPFSSHPIVACEAAANRVAYYVFRTTQVSFLQINTGGYFAAVYDKDVRTDSLQFATATPIQRCNSSIGNIQFCNFQPGTYTLVIFAKDVNICSNVAPTIFIDRVGYSRFDFAQNAYDFGTVPPDSIYHFGKVGDVNPLHPSRPPSSDFVYCTTGAFTTDPTNAACNTTVNGNIYSTAKNQPLYDSIFPVRSGNISRRNLWYTFVVDHPGTVRIKVENKTLQRNFQPRFAVYSSDVDAALPFNAVQSGGLVDSTVAAGLKFVTMNYITGYYCYNAPNNASFYRDPCSATPTRYYILVDNVNAIAAEGGGLLPNSQIDVSIQLDSFNLVLPKFDYYSKAGDIGTVGAGVHSGLQDNYSCATRSGDPLGSAQNGCNKTLWYKFNSTITGNVRYRIRIGNSVFHSGDDIQLFKAVIPGDSTINGLKIQSPATVSSPTGNWSQTCVTTGTYYLLLPGCNRVNQFVAPEIELIEQEGDFCSRAVPVSITGAGSNTASVLVNCHTIGTDYGEFGSTLTCPQAGVTTQYKSSWFRMDIGGTDTLDVTTFLVENTNAASSDIKYRMMTGDCGAMQEQSCVLDALTQNTYECLVPGQRYYIQVFTPILKNNVTVTGTIALQLSARKHADTCLPLNNCLATANFIPSFDCTKDESVKFSNFSTFGANITYQWSFGHNGATSTAVSPSYFYPALSVDSTYTIKLIVRNTACNKVDSSIRSFTVPARPFIDFGPDISQCNSTAPIVLRAKSHPGATYLWQNNSTADSFRVVATGANDYRVRVTYNGCVNADTVRVLISPISARALQKINLCTDSVLVDVRRGFGETYRWNTGASTRSIFMSQPGYYWVDITYFDCVYRDSFEVNAVNTARPFGNDSTVCLTKGGYKLNAATNGAISYRWQNNSTADTFLVTAAGQYRVEINFGNCSVRDTINIFGYAPPTSSTTDTSICFGNTYTLPWGLEVSRAGIYRDTLKYAGGCDSLIRVVNLSVKAAPNIGNDTTLCVVSTNFVLNASTVGALGYTWQDGTTASTFTVINPGTYWVRVNYGSCTTTDTVNITLRSSPIVVRIDTALCEGSSIRLPSGLVVQSSGSYVDTVVSVAGCDSLVRTYVVAVNSRPSLGADTNVGFCLGQSTSLTTVYNTSGLTTAWTINNQPVANPASVSVAGNYRLVVTNAAGCSDTAFVTVSIFTKPALGNDQNASICSGSAFNLTNAYATAGLNASWTLNGVPVVQPAAVTTAGNYQLIAINNFGCADTAVVRLTVNVRPFVGNDTSITNCSAVNLTAVYNTSGLTTTWTINNQPVANPASVSVSGNYRLVVSNAAGCSDTVVVALTISPNALVGNDTSLGSCSAVNLTAVYNTSGLVAAWTINNQAVANPSSVSVSGNYRLVVTNAAGCSDTAFVTVSIFTKPALGNDQNASICSGSAFNLTNAYATAGLNASWTLNGVPVIQPAAATIAGNYQLIATNNFGCTDTAILRLSINARPFVGNDTSIINCSAVNLAAVYNTNGLTTTWTFNNQPVANPVSVSVSGNYRLVVSNAAGCSDTVVVALTISPNALVGNDTTMGSCSAVNLSSVYNTSGLTTTWTINNQPVANPASVSVSGNYRLVVANPAGCSDTAFVTVSIFTKPALGNDQNASICSGNAFNLNNAYSTAGFNTSWTLNGVPVVQPAAVTTAGNYQLIAVNNFGCADTAVVRLTVNAGPFVGNDTSITNCSSVNLVTVYNTSGLNSTWTFNNQPVANPASVIVSGNYRLVISNAAGCSDTAFVTVSIFTKPALGDDQNASICSGTAFNLNNAYSTAGLNASWTLNGVPVVQPAAVTTAGNYQLIAVNNFGCADTAVVRLVVNARPFVGDDTSITNCSAVNLAAVYDTSGLTATWTVNNQPVANPAAVTVAGNYRLVVTNAAGCSDTVVVALTISPNGLVGNDTSMGSCSAVNLTSVYNTSGLVAAWTINNQPVANPDAVTVAGNYRLVVSNAAGCSDTAFVMVSIFAKPALGNDQNQSICSGSAFNLNNAYATAGLNASWTLNGVPVVQPAAVTTAGNYQLIAANNFGCADTAVVRLTVNARPFVGNDTSVINCSAVNLTAVYNTSGLSTTWTINNQPVANPGSVSVSGNYRLVVANPAGCSDTVVVALTINSKPSLGIDQIQRICSGSTFNLTTAYATTGLATTWTLNGNPVVQSAAVSSAGNYQLIAVNSVGCSDTALLALTISPKPNLGNDIVSSICSDSSINLLSQFNTGSNSNVWTIGGTVVANPTAVNVTGQYQLISITPSGCADTAIVDLAVSVVPALVINNPPALCVPQTADLTNAAVTAGTTPGVGLSYWANTMATVALSNAASVSDGTYYIKGTNSAGCFSIMPVVVRSHPVPVLNAGPDKSICSNDSLATLAAQVSNTTAPVTYQWTPIAVGGIQSPSAASTMVRPAAAIQQYIVTITDGYGCNYKVSDSVVVIKQPPVPAFAGNDTFAIVGQPIRLRATGGVSYLWVPANLLSNPAISNPLATINTDSVLFTVTVTDASGCKATDGVLVRSIGGGTIHVPNAFSPGGDGLNEVFRPIPAGIVLASMHFRVFNRYGALMFETNRSMHGWDGRYKGEAQPGGNYVWQLQAKTANGKLIEMKGNVVLIR